MQSLSQLVARKAVVVWIRCAGLNSEDLDWIDDAIWANKNINLGAPKKACLLYVSSHWDWRQLCLWQSP